MTLEEPYATLAATLWNTNGTAALHERFRALFALKNLSSNLAVQIVAQALDDPSALLKHELAYVLGQMKNPTAIPHLTRVLEDEQQDTMVRHEAAEALGAIACPSSLAILQRYASDEKQHRAVQETCELAVAQIQLLQQTCQDQPPSQVSSKYASIDPAPPLAEEPQSVEELERQLLDTSLPLFERYRAMFSLRNRGGKEAVLALARGFRDESELFRHEIAYVFGQMQDVHSVEALRTVLENQDEAAMVRHECAEALGSIASPECLPILKRFCEDKERVVRESCIVALDMYAYETSQELPQFWKPSSVVVAGISGTN